MNELRIYIADDEAPARARMKELLADIRGELVTKIVGESVGLHPMTVIASVFLWALILGGLLGAILAVPMTASIKVLFQRYIWRARLAAQTVGGATQAAVVPADG